MHKTPLILALLLLLAGCSLSESTEPPAPTGHPSGQAQIEMVYVNGHLYYLDLYCEESFDRIPEGFTLAGAVTASLTQAPSEELHSAHVAEGSLIHTGQDTKYIFIQYDSGAIRRFVDSSTIEWS